MPKETRRGGLAQDTAMPKTEIAINTYRPSGGATAQPKAPPATTSESKPSPPPSKND